ncbi:MAG TPA: zinc-binding dehydrogenase [Kofleriaceae bacterium]
MRALQQRSLAGPQDLHLVELPVPTPRDGEVLLRVAAAGVNFVDVSRSHGTFGNNPQPPFVAGFESAGEVVATGAKVVCAGPGAFAEYMIAPTAMPIPDGWTCEQALGLVVNWPTALAAFKLGRLAAGETVLVHAAAGATGQAALALARHRGARVIAAASTPKHVEADQVVDSRAPDLAARVLELTGGRGVDLVLESAGGETLAASLAATKRVTGRVVVVGLAGGIATFSNWDLVYTHPVQIIGFNLGVLIQTAPQIFGEIMGELGALIGAGVIAPARPTRYALADGRQALLDLEQRTTIGKLALIP